MLFPESDSTSYLKSFDQSFRCEWVVNLIWFAHHKLIELYPNKRVFKTVVLVGKHNQKDQLRAKLAFIWR